MTKHEMIQILINYADVSPETIDCVTSVYGYTEENCENILYWKTGYEDFVEFMKDWEEYND